MYTHIEEGSPRSAFWRFYDWANEKLYPILGPADLEPYEPALDQVAQALCPLCGVAMSEHYFDRSREDVVLYCPRDEQDNPNDSKALDSWGRVKA